MNKLPKISVVIPICNVGKYVKKCIKSVMEQTLKEIEIICVDDGSTDNSLKIMRELAVTDSRIQIISKENTGYGNSVNIGINVCRGEYIAIIESDDFIEKNMLEDLYNLKNGQPIDIIKGNFWDYYETKDREEDFVNKERAHVPVQNGKFNVHQNPEILWGHPSIWSAIYRRDFLIENGIKFMEEPGGGWVDNPFFFETIYLAKSIIWTNTPYYHYRKTNANSSSNKQVDLTLPMKRMIDNLKILEKYNCKDEGVLKVAYARAFMYLRGVFLEKHWGMQYSQIREYGHKMMKMVNENIILAYFNIRDQKMFYDYINPIEKIIPKTKKILIYNWIQFDNKDHYGGGVNVYCHNLIETIIRERPDIQVYFLSSGWAYDASTTDCYIRTTNNKFSKSCLSFEIVNSPVPAAQNLLLNNPKCAIKNEILRNRIEDFINKCGGFDVIHFNNIEGLSLNILDLKEKYKNTRFIYSLHNYIPFCITGFYFKRQEGRNCNPGHTCEDCLRCTEIGRRHDLSNEIYWRALLNIESRNVNISEENWKKYFGFNALDNASDPKYLKEFCVTAVEKINKNIDVILAVSERVKQLAIENGMDKDKIYTSYIGTKVAEFQSNQSNVTNNKYFKLGYLGSDINFEEKGYPFLLKTLKSFSEDEAKNIDLFLTTTNGNIEKIKSNLKQFHSVIIKKGYNHTELRNMLSDINLGVIPVLWEDNLPQISIEMVAMGVPILCSSFGGASELCKNDLFKFEGGNAKELKNKIIYFANNRDKLDEYWENHCELKTMRKHWSELEKYFNVNEPVGSQISFETLATFNKAYTDMLYNEDGEYKTELDVLRNSLSYKVGEKITYVPRMGKKVINSIKINGIEATIKK